MVLRLILVRHAKSDWDEPALADFDRPLAPRGRTDAAWIGEAFRTLQLAPARILCSTALRTRETLELAGVGLGADLVWSDAVYRERDSDYLDLIAAEGATTPLMLVGHNTAIEQTAMMLTGTGGPGAIASLRGGFPAGAIAVLDFELDDWAAAAPAIGHLALFLRPPKA